MNREEMALASYVFTVKSMSEACCLIHLPIEMRRGLRGSRNKQNIRFEREEVMCYSHGHLLDLFRQTYMKNWDPLVSFPLFAIDRR